VLSGEVRVYWVGACALGLLLCALAWPQRTPFAQAQTPALQPPAATTPTPAQQPSASPTPTDEEVARVETNLVGVLFNAVDKERHFVTTLTQTDVQVFEDNVPQQINSFERETDLPLSLAILFDASASQQQTLGDEKEAAHLFVASVTRPRADRVALISFTGDATVEQDLTNDVAALQRAIEHVEIVRAPEDVIHDPSASPDAVAAARAAIISAQTTGDRRLPGSTAIWDAVWATSRELLAHTPEQTRRALILLTDGDDTSSQMSREEAIDAALKTGALIYAIGIEPICDDCHFDKKALRKVAEQTGGRAFFPKDEQQLRAAFTQIEQELRTQYVFFYAPTNKAQDGTFRTVRLDITNPALQKQKLALTYRHGYYANPPASSTRTPPRPPGQRLTRPPPRRRH
jgi:Ca-activated chloride channel homolog